MNSFIAAAANQTTGYVYAGTWVGGLLLEIDWPEAGRESTTLAYDYFQVDDDFLTRVVEYSDGRGTWTYAYATTPPNHNLLTTTVTDPNNQQTTYRARLGFTIPPGDSTSQQRLLWVRNADNETTYTDYDYKGRLIKVTYPEGNILQTTYDARGNVTEVRQIAKPAAPATDIVASATFAATCSNRVTCNLPESTTDARGAVTNYTYNSVHGGVLTETLPAPTVGAARPQTRYTYQAQSAWYRTSASTTKVQGATIWVPTASSACVTGTSCAGTANEVISSTTYQVGSASVGSNLLPIMVSGGSGNGSLTAVTTTTWDVNGDPKAVDGPLPGTADTTWRLYDGLRRVVGQISPDPDGAGPLAFSALRNVYNADGQVISVQTGTTTAQSDSAFTAFASLSRVDTTYDAQSRKVRETQVIGTGTTGVTQYSYDGEGRLQCTAMRMNPASWGALPASACTLASAGPDGPDRITHNTYDNADRLTVMQSAYGTPLAQATRRQDWTANGQVDWVQDANNNRTDYTYDGFDRLIRQAFPSTTVGAQTANAADYEQYGYDANGNRISLRLRDNQTITLTYDALNRETVKTVPGSSAANDVFSTYDNLGRRLAARNDNATSGAGVVWTWDALGRQLTETAYGRTLTSAYDIAGRRTRLTWPAASGASALYLDFTWDLANRLDQVRENGATSGVGLLADYAYDNLGRRTGLTRGNGAPTTWAYTPNSTSWSLTHNLASTGQDLTQAYVLNPAGQVRERSLSNTAYSWAAPALAQAYARDGLNRYTSVSGAAFTYDGRGNLTDDGPRTYGYDVENRLTSVSGGASLGLIYDPLGRLRQTTGVSGTTQFLYDGDRLAAEYNTSGAVTARYAHGPGPDEPLVWYQGAGLTDRRWLHADAQGSIIAASGPTGAIVGLPYRYGPYGEPDADYGYASGSRFRYTGQTTLRDVPLWHYKARAYDPVIGRFLQTDPIGYADQMNLYAYVANDPINGTDPTGKTARVTVFEEQRKVLVIIPVTVSGELTYGEVSAAVESISQTVIDDDGNEWQVSFKTVEGSLRRRDTGERYTNHVTTSPNMATDQGRMNGEDFRSGGTSHSIVGVNPAGGTERKTVAHEVGGHGAGLADQYRNPSFVAAHPGNLMINDRPPGTGLTWAQVQMIQYNRISRNDVVWR